MNKSWLYIVADAHRAGVENYSAEGFRVRRVRGGANNAIYCVRADSNEYAVKLCVSDERLRAQREYGALCLLQRAGLKIAPEPILIDEFCSVLPFPIVAYRWVEGKTLTAQLTRDQLSAVLASIQAYHALAPKDFRDVELRDAWFHWFAFEPYLDELKKFLDQYGAWLAAKDAEGKELSARLARLVERCLAVVLNARIDPSREKIALRLAHVDPSLANAVWDSSRKLRWIDWEFSGWGDPALELADVRWHIALEDVSEEQHAWLRENYRRPDDDAEFEERLAIWDRILVTRWTFLVARTLKSAYEGPDRVRLTMPQENTKDIRARLIRTMERAEKFL